jgi:hypothetical protein
MKRIIYQNETGGVSIIIPTESVELALKDVPEGVAYEIVDKTDIPEDRTFRGAWVMGSAGWGWIQEDLDKCKEIGHDIRRTQRAEEFKPFDEVIMKQIPGADAAVAEEARQTIREKYSDVQDAIDAAETPDDIKAALEVTP